MSLRRIARIARWEIQTSTGQIDRQTVAVVVVLLAIGGGGIAVGLVGGGSAVDDEIYRVGIDAHHPYAPAVDAHGPLRAVPPDAPAEVHVVGDEIDVGTSDRAAAAFGELRTAIRQYNQLQLREEPDQAAAFPVVVEVQFVETAGPTVIEQATTTPDDEPADDTETEDPPSGDEEPESVESPESSADDGTAVPSLPAIGDRVLPEPTAVGTPAELSPPFPFRSLVLAFLFLVPLNFVIQAYGSTIIDERINRRGEALLASPATPREIVAGKTAPYLLGATGLLGGIAVALGVGVFGTLGVVALAGLFLAATFVSALLARSYQELTFLTVAISVVGTSYAFVPAIFTEVTPVALISPLTLVVFDLEGQSVTLLEGLVSVAPAVTTGAVLFWLGTGIYRAESLFAHRPPRRALLKMLGARIIRRRDVGLVTAVLLPIVVLMQLFALAVLFVVPAAVALPVMLVLVSVIEETAKSIHVFAAYQYDRFGPSVRTAAGLGVVSGAVFFFGETLLQVLQLVGVADVDLGPTVVTPGGLGGPLAVLLLAAPLALHIVTATIASIGARGDRRRYLLFLGAAVVVHTLYNAGVIALVG